MQYQNTTTMSLKRLLYVLSTYRYDLLIEYLQKKFYFRSRVKSVFLFLLKVTLYTVFVNWFLLIACSLTLLTHEYRINDCILPAALERLSQSLNVASLTMLI